MCHVGLLQAEKVFTNKLFSHHAQMFIKIWFIMTVIHKEKLPTSISCRYRTPAIGVLKLIEAEWRHMASANYTRLLTADLDSWIPGFLMSRASFQVPTCLCFDQWLLKWLVMQTAAASSAAAVCITRRFSNRWPRFPKFTRPQWVNRGYLTKICVMASDWLTASLSKLQIYVPFIILRFIGAE